MIARAIRPLLTLLLLAAAGVCAGAPRVLVVLSKPDTPYQALASAIAANLAPARASEIDLKVENLEAFRVIDIPVHRPTLIVTVGVEAARQVAQTNPPAPILHTLLPRAAALDILRSGRNGKPTPQRDSAIFLDQPIGRQLDLIRLALPRHKRVAMVLGPTTQSLSGEIRAGARERGLSLGVATLTKREELLPILEDLIDDNDVLLSIADPMVYHSETVHHVLLTTYRYKVPVIGFSRSYVDAGALLAVYSTPAHIGHQVAQLIATLPATGSATLPAPQYPRFFQVAINQRVANSLDLMLKSEAELQTKLEALARP
jgi:ABC-type uncharacterized transport system substrate-binding protein